jgi:methionyl-tRNA synthetase
MVKAQAALDDVDKLLYQCHFKEGIKTAMSLAQEANRYLDDKAPWKTLKQDIQASATAVYVALSVLAALKTIFYPFLPFSSERLHKFLGFDGSVETTGWQVQSLVPGQKLLAPEPLFHKLDDNIVAEETSRLLSGRSDGSN